MNTSLTRLKLKYQVYTSSHNLNTKGRATHNQDINL